MYDGPMNTWTRLEAARFMEAITHFDPLGATRREISLPIHRVSGAIRAPIAVEGGLQTILHNDGVGLTGPGLYLTSLLDRSRGWRARANELPEPLVYMALFGQHVTNRHGTHYYAKAQNIVRRMTALYDAVFEEVDVLVMPTLPMVATPLPPPDGKGDRAKNYCRCRRRARCSRPDPPW